MSAPPRFLRGLLLAAWTAVAASAALAQAVIVPKPGPRDLCPVCGMIVSKYPNWVATVLYKDGHAHHFDGPKDMFKYLHDLPRYAPGHRPEDIARIVVTDFYDLGKIEAQSAWFVIGSDVLGPMGHEFIPLASREDAAAFEHEHKGVRTLRFDAVTPAVVEQVDHGRFR